MAGPAAVVVVALVSAPATPPLLVALLARPLQPWALQYSATWRPPSTMQVTTSPGAWWVQLTPSQQLPPQRSKLREGQRAW